MPNGPCEFVDVRRGDLLLEVDGVPAGSTVAGVRPLFLGNVGTIVKLTLRRGANSVSVNVRRAQLPSKEEVKTNVLTQVRGRSLSPFRPQQQQQQQPVQRRDASPSFGGQSVARQQRTTDVSPQHQRSMQVESTHSNLVSNVRRGPDALNVATRKIAMLENDVERLTNEKKQLMQRVETERKQMREIMLRASELESHLKGIEESWGQVRFCAK